jgi:hypothetical protein
MTRPLEIHLPRLPFLFAHNLHISNAEGKSANVRFTSSAKWGLGGSLALMGLDKISDET